MHFVCGVFFISFREKILYMAIKHSEYHRYILWRLKLYECQIILCFAPGCQIDSIYDEKSFQKCMFTHMQDAAGGVFECQLSCPVSITKSKCQHMRESLIFSRLLLVLIWPQSRWNNDIMIAIT